MNANSPRYLTPLHEAAHARMVIWTWRSTQTLSNGEMMMSFGKERSIMHYTEEVKSNLVLQSKKLVQFVVILFGGIPFRSTNRSIS